MINFGNYFSQLDFRVKRIHELLINSLIKHNFQVAMHVSRDKLHSLDIFYYNVGIFMKVDSSFAEWWFEFYTVRSSSNMCVVLLLILLRHLYSIFVFTVNNFLKSTCFEFNNSSLLSLFDFAYRMHFVYIFSDCFILCTSFFLNDVYDSLHDNHCYLYQGSLFP